jgi:hypothetical protein
MQAESDSEESYLSSDTSSYVSSNDDRMKDEADLEDIKEAQEEAKV